MTAPRTVTSIDAIVDLVTGMRASRPHDARLLVGLVGAPGAGKSTVAGELAARLEAPVVPMDGFHLPQEVLRELGRRERMGAPDTFDVDGFVGLLTQLRLAQPERAVLAPAFDRGVEEPVPDAIALRPEHRTVVVEGNYLLLNRAPWDRLRPLFDVTVELSCPLEVLEARLMARWLDLGLPEAVAREKVEGNDLPNARTVAEESVPAEFRITTV